MFFNNLISEGKLKAHKAKLNTLIGQISNKRGNEFCNKVYRVIKQVTELEVQKQVKKINSKYISDENNNTLGDVDVLFINKDIKHIVLVEVKDFNLSKNPYEIVQEYKTMFVDTEKRKSFYTKHNRRKKWFEEHIEDVKAHYDLNADDWLVKSIFIVNEEIMSNSIYGENAEILTFSQINKDILISI